MKTDLQRFLDLQKERDRLVRELERTQGARQQLLSTLEEEGKDREALKRREEILLEKEKILAPQFQEALAAWEERWRPRLTKEVGRAP